MFGAMLPVAIGIVVIIASAVWSSYRIRFTWPLTTGTVISSRTLEGRGKYGEPTYGLGLTVEYGVQGQSYIGNAQTQVWTSEYQQNLEELAAYPPGTKGQVRFNPADHSQLRLWPDLVQSIPVSAVLGIVVVGIGLGLAFVRHLRRHADSAAVLK